MLIDLAFFSDPGLTAPATSLVAPQADDGSIAAVERRFYLGSAVAGKTFRAASNPGVDPIAVSVADSNGVTGATAARVRLALTQAGLASATPGAPLVVGTQITSASPVSIWARLDGGALAAGMYTDLALVTSPVEET